MVRAKFRCNCINLAIGTRLHEDVAELAKKTGKSDYPAIQALAAELGVPAHVPFDMPTVILSPVYAGPDASDEDKAFWESSPTGKLELTITNAAAAETFELGKTYYVTFEPAPDGD